MLGDCTSLVSKYKEMTLTYTQILAKQTDLKVMNHLATWFAQMIENRQRVAVVLAFFRVLAIATPPCRPQQGEG